MSKDFKYEVPRYSFPFRTTDDGGNKLEDEVDGRWVMTAMMGMFGGSLAYWIYCKRMKNLHYQAANASRAQPSMNLEAEFACIRHLPAEIRTRIWKALPYEDRLKLRLISHFTKDDIDTFVGLSGKISALETEKFDFYQRIALSSCQITELQDPITQDFLFNPAVLESLDIREHSPIPLNNIEAILQVTENLKQLKLRLLLNDDSGGVSRVVVDALQNMKSLAFLHIKTMMHYTPDIKNFSRSASPQFSFSGPKFLKMIHLEMPDLPENEVAKWKSVLDKQVCLEKLIVNLGNVNWRYYERILGQNSGTLEKICLEGVRSWDYNRNVEDPLDWSVFSDFAQLRSVDLSCTRGGEHDFAATVNFDMFPCAPIEEFFISRMALTPQAVERVYNEMVNLHRGALDHIGNAGIERANEMAWIIQHAEDRDNERAWWQEESIWDLAAHAVFGISLLVVLALVVKTKSGSTGFGEVVETANEGTSKGGNATKLFKGK